MAQITFKGNPIKTNGELPKAGSAAPDLKLTDGKLVSSEVNFYNVGRNAEELVRKMSANAYLSKHPEEVCPSGWKEGAKTLKPGPNMVGKVYEALK